MGNMKQQNLWEDISLCEHTKSLEVRLLSGKNFFPVSWLEVVMAWALRLREKENSKKEYDEQDLVITQTQRTENTHIKETWDIAELTIQTKNIILHLQKRFNF